MDIHYGPEPDPFKGRGATRCYSRRRGDRGEGPRITVKGTSAGETPRQSGLPNRNPLTGVSGLNSRYTDVAGPPNRNATAVEGDGDTQMNAPNLERGLLARLSTGGNRSNTGEAGDQGTSQAGGFRDSGC